MKKTMILATCFVLMIFCLNGCKSNEPQSFTFEANSVKGIEIETGANSVSIVKNSSNNIEVSYTQDVTTIEDKVLKINIPMPNAGVNIKKAADVTVSVPDTIFDYIQIKSEAGNVTIGNINTDILTVETQFGNITLSGIEGHIAAKAELGTIKTDLPIASEIKSIGKAGQEADGQNGTSEKEISLYTNTGIIELK